MTFPLEVSIPGILSNQTSTQWPTYVKLNARMKASNRSKRAASAAEIRSASGSARSVLRTRCFIQMHLHPVEHGAPPDAPIARPQHPVPFVREVEELRLDSHAFRRGIGLIP